MEVFIGLFAVAIYLVPLILALVNKSKVDLLNRRIEELERAFINQNSTFEDLRKRSITPASKPELKKSSKPQEPPVIATNVVEPPQVIVKTPEPPTEIQPPPDKVAEVAAEKVEGSPQLVVGRSGSPLPSMTPPHPIFQPTESIFATKSRTSKEWEALIGGKILNRIGAVALIIGMGFFLKYAFENNWITETMRVILGAIAGGGLLFVAARSHKKGFEIFSQGLVGAGISILYLSVYAAFNFYHVVPQFAAFVLMSCVTMLTLWQAWKYDSLAVALLGWAGGVLTPFMLSTGETNEVGMFTYIALFDAGLLAIALSKEKWIILEPLTVAATYLIYFVWFESSYVPEALAKTIFFLTLFWLLFFAFQAVRHLKKFAASYEILHELLIANAALYFVGMYQLIEPDHHSWMGVITLLTGVPYLLMFLGLRRRGAARQSLLDRYVLSAIVLLFTATAIHFSGFTTAILWSLEALTVVYAGSKLTMKSVWIAAVVMFAFSFFKLFFSDGSLWFMPLEEFRLIVNMRALSYFTLGATLLASSELFRQREENIAKLFHIGLSYAWCVTFFILFSVETNDLFSRWMLYAEGTAHDFLSFKRDLTVGIVWMAYSVALAWFGFWRNARPALFSGTGVLLLALGIGGLHSIAFEPIEQYSFIFNYRVLTIVFLVAGTIAHAWMWRKHGATLKHSNGVLNAITVSIVLLIFILLTAETYDGFENLLVNATGNPFELLSFKRVLTLALVWTAYSLPLTWFGLTKKSKYVVYCGIGVMGLGLFVGLVRSLWYEPVEWFSLLFNYRFFATCLLIAGAVLQLLLWRKNSREVEWNKTLVGGISLIIVALMLVLLTSETRDFFEQKICSVEKLMIDEWSHDLEAQVNSLRNMQQLSLSGVWLLYSIMLMVVGLWRRNRRIRLVAIGLFGVTILKIFVYDLSFLQTLYRICSFMGLGVILLAVSYLYQKYKSIILETEAQEKSQETAVRDVQQ